MDNVLSIYCQYIISWWTYGSSLAPIFNFNVSVLRGDEVTCIVNFIHDASRFSVRITEYSRIDADGKKQTKKISAVQFVTFSDKLQKYFSQPKNQ